jgi:hypothetical protein
VSAIGVVAAAAGGVEKLREGLILPLLAAGHEVAVTLTPTAAEWLEHLGEIEAITVATGIPVRSRPRLPGQTSPHPRIDAYLGAPMTANSVAKLALGIADNQALTVLGENIGTDTPMIIFPRINAAHARQPAWSDHLDRLRRVGVQLAYGDDIWPLYEPRTAGSRELPWQQLVTMVIGSLQGSASRLRVASA